MDELEKLGREAVQQQHFEGRQGRIFGGDRSIPSPANSIPRPRRRPAIGKSTHRFLLSSNALGSIARSSVRSAGAVARQPSGSSRRRRSRPLPPPMKLMPSSACSCERSATPGCGWASASISGSRSWTLSGRPSICPRPKTVTRGPSISRAR